jgi:hypothetical protein
MKPCLSSGYGRSFNLLNDLAICTSTVALIERFGERGRSCNERRDNDCDLEPVRGQHGSVPSVARCPISIHVQKVGLHDPITPREIAHAHHAMGNGSAANVAGNSTQSADSAFSA